MKAQWKRTAILMCALSGFVIGCAKDANMLQRTSFETDSFGRAIEWINSPPLDTTQLRGNVVLVDFWTYSCINWRRTMPYLRNWAGEVSGPWAGGDRRAHAGVQLREGHR